MPTPALRVMGVLPPTRQDHLSLGGLRGISQRHCISPWDRGLWCACIRVNVIAIRCRVWKQLEDVARESPVRFLEYLRASSTLSSPHPNTVLLLLAEDASSALEA